MGGTLRDAAVEYPDAAAAACARDAVGALDLSQLELPESAVWTVRMPFAVGAHS
jgi:hypothetical protein